jgi:hypothetical protein
MFMKRVEPTARLLAAPSVANGSSRPASNGPCAFAIEPVQDSGGALIVERLSEALQTLGDADVIGGLPSRRSCDQQTHRPTPCSGILATPGGSQQGPERGKRGDSSKSIGR